MTQSINLRELERKAWRTVYNDGLWDIYLGMLLMAMAVNVLLQKLDLTEVQSMLLYTGMVLLSLVLFWLSKRLITVPRMGRFKPGPKGKARKRKARVVLLLSVVVGLVVFATSVSAFRGQKPLWLNPAIFFPTAWAANMLLVFGLAAHFLDFPRLYVVAVMYAVALPLDIVVNELFDVRLGFWAFGVPAAVILTMGGLVLARFLRTYPPLPGNERLAANGQG